MDYYGVLYLEPKTKEGTSIIVGMEKEFVVNSRTQVRDTEMNAFWKWWWWWFGSP